MHIYIILAITWRMFPRGYIKPWKSIEWKNEKPISSLWLESTYIYNAHSSFKNPICTNSKHDKILTGIYLFKKKESLR